MKVQCTKRKKKKTTKQFGGVGIGFWSWKRMMRMQGQLLSQISGSLSGGLPVAASGAPGRMPYWNEVPSPRLLATPDIWAFVCVRVHICVYVCGVFRVKGGGLVFPPRDPIASAPLLLVSPSSTPTLRRPPSIGPSFSFAYSFKSRKCLLRSNMGLRQGGPSGPSAGVENTATTRWREGGGGERKREVEDAQTSDRRWLQMASWLPLFFPFLVVSSSLSLCVHSLFLFPFFCYFSVFPHWCSAHQDSAQIGKCSPLDPAAETKQGFKPGPVCVWGWSAFKETTLCPPFCHYFTLCLSFL